MLLCLCDFFNGPYRGFRRLPSKPIHTQSLLSHKHDRDSRKHWKNWWSILKEHAGLAHCDSWNRSIRFPVPGPGPGIETIFSEWCTDPYNDLWNVHVLGDFRNEKNEGMNRRTWDREMEEFGDRLDSPGVGTQRPGIPRKTQFGRTPPVPIVLRSAESLEK